MFGIEFAKETIGRFWSCCTDLVLGFLPVLCQGHIGPHDLILPLLVYSAALALRTESFCADWPFIGHYKLFASSLICAPTTDLSGCIIYKSSTYIFHIATGATR